MITISIYISATDQNITKFAVEEEERGALTLWGLSFFLKVIFTLYNS